MLYEALTLALFATDADIALCKSLGFKAKETTQVISLLGGNQFHQVCNTVRMYEPASQSAAFIAYRRRYVEAQITLERVNAYRIHVARPHFGTVTSNKVKPLAPADVRMLVAALRSKAYNKADA